VKHIIRKILKEVRDEKTFHDLFGEKGRWVELNRSEAGEIKKNLYDLVTTAYSFDNGHVSVPTPESVTNLKFWKAADIDNDPFADVVVFGRESRYGIKISGIGHNGDGYSRKQVVQHLAEILNTSGFWIEVSDRLAEVLLERYNVPIVDNQEDAEKVLGNPIQEWLGNGWYKRVVNKAGKVATEVLVGKPRV
jgi:hypothetical protein